MKTLAAAGFLALLLAVGATDALVNRGEILANLQASADESPATSAKPVAVPRMAGPDILALIEEAGLTATASSTEQSLLAQVSPQASATVQTRVLLLGNDRIGAIAWMEDGDAKTLFLALKQALLASFSPQVQGLRDEKIERQGFMTHTLLTFIDPALSTERFLFTQFGQDLVEMHVVPGRENVAYDLIERMTKR